MSGHDLPGQVGGVVVNDDDLVVADRTKSLDQAGKEKGDIVLFIIGRYNQRKTHRLHLIMRSLRQCQVAAMRREAIGERTS